jgi:aldose 1-epimerase
LTIVETTRQRHPSGHQYAIAHGNAQAHIAQVGATLRTYTVDGRDVLDGFGIDERATDGRGQILAPWPNRLTDGRYQYGGRDCQAPINETSRNTAIHGLVRWLDWSLVGHDPTSVTLSCAVRPQPGYEWQLDLEVTYALDHTGLTVTLRAVNVGAERAPLGVGFHPYLTLGTPSIDELELTLPATTYRDSDLSAAPAMVPVTATPWNFTQPRRIGTTQLDTAFGGLIRHDDDRAITRIHDPDGGHAVELWVDGTYRYLMVYTADRVGQPERRRTAIAIEPMTCPPDALRTGTDLIELDAGGSWQGSWGLQLVQSPVG